MNILVWIIFGGLAGWIATMIMGENARFGVIANIIIGVIGAWLGGWISQKVGFGTITGFDIKSFVIAIVGSVILLFIISFFQRRTA